MTNKSDNLLPDIVNIDEISELIDLSQISLSPSFNIWSKRDGSKDVLSDVSSSDTNKRSSISKSPDSVSVMTSSESDDSVNSLEELELESSHQTQYEDDLIKSQASIFGGDLFNIEKQLEIIQKLKEDLSKVFSYLIVQSSFNIESILRSSFQHFEKLHTCICTISSLDYISRKSNHVNKKTILNFLPIFKELYSDLISFHTHMCKLLSKDISSNIVSLLLKLIPYLMDTLFCILLFLLYRITDKNTQGELIGIFEKIFVCCVILCCSYIDNSNDFINKMSILSISMLTVTFLPLDMCYNIKVDSVDQQQNDYDFRVSLVEDLLNEYMDENFRPSSILLYKLRSRAYGSPTPKHEYEIKLISKLIQIVETCIRTGISRLIYPTNPIDPMGCFKLLQSASVDSLWSRLNFWLLHTLDNVDTSIRKLSLKILKHSMCTINFNERDRQFILSYVYNCLSDQETFSDSLSLLNCVSKLYPMKDGAVKRIATLTLKGSRGNLRLKVIDFFSKSRYTLKGLSMLLSVYKSLSQYSNDNQSTSESQTVNESQSETKSTLTSIISNAEDEYDFTINEWPKIVFSMVLVSDSHRNISYSVNLKDDLTPYIGKRGLSSLPAYLWIPLLWSYLSNTNDDRWRIYKCLWFSEAKIRFPRIVKTLSESDKSILERYQSVLKQYLDFGTKGNPDITDEFISDKENWRIIHELSIPYPLDNLDKTFTIFNDEFTLKEVHEPHEAILEICSCVDCRMDSIITDFENKQFHENNSLKTPFEPLNDVFEDGKICEKYKNYMEVDSTNLPFDDDLLHFHSSISHPNTDIRHKYTFAMCRFKYNPLNYDIENIDLNVDDQECYEFPTSLGTEIKLNFICKSNSYPSDLLIYYKYPKVINSELFEDGLSLNVNNSKHRHINVVRPKLKKGNNNNYKGELSIKLNFPYATSLPFPLEFYYFTNNTKKKFGLIWVHPKRPM